MRSACWRDSDRARPASASPARSRAATRRARRRRWRNGSSRRRCSPRTQPDRKPAENASPAPSTFSTSTVTPWPLNASSSDRGIATVDHRAAHRPALDHERGRRHEAHGVERRDDVGVASGDREFLLGADHEVEERQDALQVRGDRVARDEAGLAVAALGEAPQHRPVVDVEHGAHVVPARALERRRAHAVHVRRREMRAGDEQRLRLREEILGDVVFGHRHVGAVLAIEDQRERVAVLDAEHDGRGEPRRVDADVRDVAAFARERLREEAAHRVVADARRHRRLEAEPRAAERGVGRRAAEVLGEARDVFEPRADLLRVEIDGETAEADDVEAPAGGKAGVVLHRREGEVRRVRGAHGRPARFR